MGGSDLHAFDSRGFEAAPAAGLTGGGSAGGVSGTGGVNCIVCTAELKSTPAGMVGASIGNASSAGSGTAIAGFVAGRVGVVATMLNVVDGSDKPRRCARSRTLGGRTDASFDRHAATVSSQRAAISLAVPVN